MKTIKIKKGDYIRITKSKVPIVPQQFLGKCLKVQRKTQGAKEIYIYASSFPFFFSEIECVYRNHKKYTNFK